MKPSLSFSEGSVFQDEYAKGFGFGEAVVGGATGPAMAGPHFLPEMVLAEPRFWPKYVF